MGWAGLLAVAARWLHFCGLALGPGVLWAERVARGIAPRRGADEQRTWPVVTCGVLLLMTAEPLLLLASGAVGGGRAEGALAAQRLGLALVLWLLFGVRGRRGEPAGPKDRQGRQRLLGGALLVALATAALDGWSARPTGLSPAATWLAAVAGTVHVLAMAAWLGGLVWLLVEWPHVTVAARSVALRQLGAHSAWCVGLLVLTGSALALTHLPTLTAALETVYGRALLAKLGMLAAALAAAGSGVRAARGRVWPMRAWRVEAVCLGVVLVGAALLMTLPAPR